MNHKSIGWGLTGGSAIAFYAVSGLLLLLWPNLALLIANYALAAVLVVIGLVLILGYVRGDTLEGMMGLGMAKGLVLALLGVLLFVRSDLLVTVLPFLWGLAMIAGGFAKLQMANDLRRIGGSRWGWMLAGALVSFALGILSVTQPAFLAYTVTQFAGLSLLVEAVLDLAALFSIRRAYKRYRAAAKAR
ncbi:MAG: DUF308 domain-containing protein [Candidatus Limiplasma sp.]|nr:DUF308 domain-containing protein [Candidatus Limiplasma sp.]